MPIDAATEDFFRLRLDHMIDLRHSLAVLSSRMPWQQIEASVAHLFSGKVRAGKKLSGINLFGEQVQMSAVKSHAGRPPVLDAVGKDGTPDARTVVLLCAETNMQSMQFFTDSRTPKAIKVHHTSPRQFWFSVASV